jgi:hypothetical protein
MDRNQEILTLKAELERLKNPGKPHPNTITFEDDLGQLKTVHRIGVKTKHGIEAHWVEPKDDKEGKIVIPQEQLDVLHNYFNRVIPFEEIK